MSERVLAKGDRVAGDCTVIETLEETETGIRYLAERHGRHVEVIEYFPAYATRKDGAIRVAAGAARQLFRDGLAAFRKLGEFLRDSPHAGLGAIHAVKEAGETCCFIAERVEGTDFGKALEEELFVRPARPESASRWDLEALLPRLLAGLAEVHRNGLMHGNIRAANVVVRPDSTTPVLVGFGLGPLPYDGDEAVGPWMDVRALGELAHAALEGGRSDAGPAGWESGGRSRKADRRLEEAVAGALGSARGRGPQDAGALLTLSRGRGRWLRFLVPAAAVCGGLAAAGALAWFLLGQYAPLRDGEVFRDCAECPEMVVVPAGRFLMGCVSGRDCHDSEFPVHGVEIGSFALGVYEVTFEEYDRFVQATGRGEPGDEGWGRGNRPVILVSWEDAEAYVAWLSRETGESYRLPSESEWEYAARAGTRTRYSWGSELEDNRANCGDCGSETGGGQTVPAGSFAPNKWGLHDMHGNVWEWVADCWHENYGGAPEDGSAWTSGGDCRNRVVRGGSWHNDADYIRAGARLRYGAGSWLIVSGFRVARTLD